MEAKRFTVDDLLDFTLDVYEEEDDDENKTQKNPSPSSLESSNPNSHDPDEHGSLDVAEEELEWLSNKDAFPAVETCLDLLTDSSGIALNHQSPVSAAANVIRLAESAVVVGPSKGQECQARVGKITTPPPPSATTIGRRCYHCLAEKTPQWRAGPMGPKTLCNACGVRYKSGRLVPEYRPACSPTFSSKLHSNSHRKVMEMRRQKQMRGMVNEACGYRVG
ncbi:GATA transcription factor 9 [Actinidia rufa]|uniref:GATA transcription factor 9 n=1 Tax=Actinidia rufa TaxID=165716 RepID=A0A7J0E8G8_9ERIC|nr:GATA transcription factor 9 [Actinidia rufa]